MVDLTDKGTSILPVISSSTRLGPVRWKIQISAYSYGGTLLKKKGPDSVKNQGLMVVAGRGFEPLTFRL